MNGDDVDGQDPMIQVVLPDIQVTTKKRTFDLTEVVDIGDSSRPHQPIRFKFPYRTYGIKIPLRRAFQPTWFSRWRWIHYDETRDLAFCHVCVRAVRHHGDALTKNGCGEATFLSTGYSNWKEAGIQTRGFSQHENSLFHLKCTESLRGRLTLPKNKNAKGESQRFLKLAAENIRLLARQGLLLQTRGVTDDEMTDPASANPDGNFAQLMRLAGCWEPETAAYLTPAVQKELLGIMVLELLHAIANDVREHRHFAMIVDELSNAENDRRVALFLRWVDRDFRAREDFVGLYSVRDAGVDSLVEVVRETLVHLNLNLSDCRGLSCRAAGTEEQLIRHLRAVEPRVVFTQRHTRDLNAAVVEALEVADVDDVVRDFVLAASGISRFLEFTPDRRVTLSVDPGRGSRWIPDADFLMNVLNNYGEVQRALDDAHIIDRDAYLHFSFARESTRTFTFLLLLRLVEKIIRVTDNLGRTLIQPESRASDGQAVTLSVATLLKMRSEESFLFLWSQTLAFCGRTDLSVNQPAAPRRHRIPNDNYSSPEDYHRRLHAEVVDAAVKVIENRFGGQGYSSFDSLESLLLKAAAGVDRELELRAVLDFYGDDFDAANLRLHLELLETAFDGRRDGGDPCRPQVDSFLIGTKPAQRCLFSEVCTLLRLLLLTPTAGVVSESAVFALLQADWRSMSKEPGADLLLLLHAHRQRCGAVCLWRCLNTFVDGDDHRLSRFGKFKRHFCCLANP